MSEEIDNRPKNAFEAAVDAATGYKPGDEDGKPDETNPGADETKPAEVKESAAPVKGKRDWVKEAWECFIKNAVDLEPTDPAGAVWEYFKKNATDELKAKVEAEGKTGASCWKFIETVARKALGGHSGHIDPVAVYAIAMHYFQDVPKDWDEAGTNRAMNGSTQDGKKAKAKGKVKKKTPKGRYGEYRSTDPKDVEAARRAQILAHRKRMADPAMKTDKAYADKVAHDLDDLDKIWPVKKAKKRGGEQGFFFDLMETPAVGPECGRQADGCRDGKEADDAE